MPSESSGSSLEVVAATTSVSVFTDPATRFHGTLIFVSRADKSHTRRTHGTVLSVSRADKACTGTVQGVDLSEAMCENARATGLYEDVAKGELCPCAGVRISHETSQ